MTAEAVAYPEQQIKPIEVSPPSTRKKLAKYTLMLVGILELYAILMFMLTSMFESPPNIVTFHINLWQGFLSTRTFKETLIWALPIMMTAMGATFNERAGVINIGLEGIMLWGAWAAIFFSFTYNNFWAGIIGAVLFGVAISLIHAVMSITFKADQIVVGVAINLFAIGLTSVLTALIWRPGRSDYAPKVETVNFYSFPFIGPILEAIQFSRFFNIPVLGTILRFVPDPIAVLNNHNYILYLGLVLIPISHFLLFGTPFGLRIRAIGENPQAAATAGIAVRKYQYIAVVISGIYASLGGAFVTLRFGLFTENVIQGEGFIGLVAMIFGKWTIIGAVLSSVFFGYFIYLSSGLKLYGRLSQSIPDPLLKIFPYVIAMVALALIGKAKAPKHIGKPYDPTED